MARIARFVAPGLPHHITQRGNRREPVFFSDEDYQAYLDLLREHAGRSGCAIWAWCLMPNHVHIIAVPRTGDGLRALVAEVHRRYAARINARNKWTGHLWQGRFSSVAMDDRHACEAIRYVSLNPVRAGLVARAEDWPWSSTRTLLSGRKDGLVDVKAVLKRTGDFAAFLAQEPDAESIDALRHSETIGRPLGSANWIERLEARYARRLSPQKRGPKKAGVEAGN